MANVEVKVLNLNECVAKFDSLTDPQLLNKALVQSCLLVENAAKQQLYSTNPYEIQSGQLRNSITYEVVDNVGVVGTNVEYAPYVEYGTGIYARDGNGRQTPWCYKDQYGEWHYTRGAHPHPFLEPALEGSRQEIADIFAQAIREETQNG